MTKFVLGINHLGMTVPDMDEATKFFKEAFGAKIAYDGLTLADEPREGETVERQLGLPQGGKMESALEQAVKAGATALSEIHGNSRYEDMPGNVSVYVTAPWGGLIELQCIPNGYYYPASSETKVWTPPKKE